jgi:hypothetical protein
MRAGPVARPLAAHFFRLALTAHAPPPALLPHSPGLVVDDATSDDNSIISLSDKKMAELELFRGDTVRVKGKRGKETVCIVLQDEATDSGSVKMNKVVRQNVSCAAAAAPLRAAREALLPASAPGGETRTRRAAS